MSTSTPKTIEHRSRQTLRRGVTFFMGTCVVATTGYVIAGWSWIDAIYMVVITVFGVGFGEVRPVENPVLKLFTVGVIMAGCSSLIYVAGGLVQMLTEGEIETMLGIRQRSREIDTLQDHTIICGYGRVGQMLAAELGAHGSKLVVLDNNSERVEKAINDGYLAVEGNAVDDETLHDVGLFRARAIASVLPDDATNVFITLTARDLSDSIRIIARAENPATERKLIRGGASHVVMPAAIGAIRIAQLAVADEVPAETLPESRFRILGNQDAVGNTGDADDAIQHEVEELAALAADLTHSMEDHRIEAFSKEPH
ncbi:Voltage-gated potassium channel Kch [Rubripirellula amarantea]|uniref:Voltage-gated potassium channel Kch n=1 Tax=Rubripirellula amarantea TaxID=2527999 RepID=A0A5C5WJR5_9BACT|nr:potassium channel family protein [Rubripirellula amarantea]TWT50379.1 Voltage-gated potassium channel Kch [Rubripirellula amarantea]